MYDNNWKSNYNNRSNYPPSWDRQPHWGNQWKHWVQPLDDFHARGQIQRQIWEEEARERAKARRRRDNIRVAVVTILALSSIILSLLGH